MSVKAIVLLTAGSGLANASMLVRGLTPTSPPFPHADPCERFLHSVSRFGRKGAVVGGMSDYPFDTSAASSLSASALDAFTTAGVTSGSGIGGGGGGNRGRHNRHGVSCLMSLRLATNTTEADDGMECGTSLKQNRRSDFTRDLFFQHVLLTCI